MSPRLRLLALDLGAESGRALVGTFDGSRLDIEEVHRFANVPVTLGGTLHWDFLRLFGETLNGIRAAGPVRSLGVDTWGVDFGLLDAHGRLLANPVHYRDARTAGVIERTLKLVNRETVYAHTGIQIIPINTLYQLRAMREAGDSQLEEACRLLLIPDLINHFLCDSDVGEYTDATTTQCFDVAHGAWATELLEALDIPAGLFPQVVAAGTPLGRLRADVASEVPSASTLTVIAPGTHDTASAVAATPLDDRTAFVSSGTWSLIGLELDRPLLSSAARDGNLTNEGGVAGTIRLLKNVMGLWLLQQLRHSLDVDYAALTAQAAAAPAFTAFIDPDDERFLRPGDIRGTVRAFCEETGQAPPGDSASLARVILESLALKYAVVLRQLESATRRNVATIRVVGGGANNALLCQLTADACGRPVLAGPTEATAIGNVLVQAISLGEIASLSEARELVARSFPARQYEPESDCAEPRQRFDSLLRSRSQLKGVLP